MSYFYLGEKFKWGYFSPAFQELSRRVSVLCSKNRKERQLCLKNNVWIVSVDQYLNTIEIQITNMCTIVLIVRIDAHVHEFQYNQ